LALWESVTAGEASFSAIWAERVKGLNMSQSASRVHIVTNLKEAFSQLCNESEVDCVQQVCTCATVKNDGSMITMSCCGEALQEKHVLYHSRVQI